MHMDAGLLAAENTHVMERGTSSRNSHLTSSVQAKERRENSTLQQADGENRKT